MNCPMAVLTEEPKTSDESERSSVSSKLFITPLGQHLHKSKMAFGSKILKIRLFQYFMDKILFKQIYFSIFLR